MVTITNIETFEESIRPPARVNRAEGFGPAKQSPNGLAHRTDDAIHAVGGSLKSLADTVRDMGPREGALGSASSTLANSLESGGHYLQHKGLNGLASDMTNCIRRNPVPTLLVGLGLGCCLARLTTRS